MAVLVSQCEYVCVDWKWKWAMKAYLPPPRGTTHILVDKHVGTGRGGEAARSCWAHILRYWAEFRRQHKHTRAHPQSAPSSAPIVGHAHWRILLSQQGYALALLVMHKYNRARAVRRNKLKLRVFCCVFSQQKVPLHGSGSPEGYIALEKVSQKSEKKWWWKLTKKKPKKHKSTPHKWYTHMHTCKN